MARKQLNVGLIGYQFMGKAHSNAYRQVGRFFDVPIEPVLHTLCGRHEGPLKEAADKYGFANTSTDWRAVVEDPAINIIDVSTPGDSHCEIVVAAAQAGKIVFCEKPIGNTLDEARAMRDAVVKAGVANAIFHNYRKAPAVALAQKMVAEGALGRIYHFRAVYLQDWIADPAFPLVWRLQKEKAGSGALGDIGSHIIDLARFIVGEFDAVAGNLHTFITERPLPGEVDASLGASSASGTGQVTVDDAAMFLARFKSGAIGTFEASRFAVGRKNHNRFEINGSLGSIVFNLERMNELEYYNASDPVGSQGFRLMQCTESSHPYASAYWPVGHIIGYEHTFVNLVADALVAIDKGASCSPDMEDGYQNQRVLDAVERSSDNCCWINL